MANVYLYDAKSLRRFDFEQSKAANRRCHAKETHKTKKKHIAQLHDKNEEKKKRVIKVNKGRDKSPQAILLRSIMQAMKVNAKFEFEHKKFKGEFGIFVKDDRNHGKPKTGQAHRHVLFRFPNELRYKNKRSTMRVYPKGCWSDSREKTVSLLIMVEVVEDWEQNAEDGLVTERNADALYPPSEDSDDDYDDDEAREERMELKRMRQKREEEKEEKKLKRMTRDEKWFLVEKKLNEENKKGSPRTKCECCNYEVSPLRDEKEIEALMKRIEKEFRKLEEGKTLDPIPDRINRLIVQKQKEEEEEAAREASILAGDAVPPKQSNSNSDTDESDD